MLSAEVERTWLHVGASPRRNKERVLAQARPEGGERFHLSVCPIMVSHVFSISLCFLLYIYLLRFVLRRRSAHWAGRLCHQQRGIVTLLLARGQEEWGARGHPGGGDVCMTLSHSNPGSTVDPR